MELRRIITDKKFLFLVFISFALTVYSFFGDMDITSDITNGRSKEVYYDGVIKVIDNAIYLRGTVENKIELKKIEKTKSDFSNITSVDIKDVNDNMLDNVVENPMPALVAVIIGIFIIGSFIEERKKGIFEFVYATYRGRRNLALRRQGILIFVISAVTVLLYGFLFAINWSVNGVPDMSAPIQSVPKFNQFVYRINIREFIVLFIALKIIGELFLINIAYLICLRFNNYAVGVFVTTVLVAVSGVLFVKINPNEVMDIFRHINIYNIIDMSRILYSYDLYYIFGIVIECKFIMLALVVIFSLVIFGTIVYLSGFKREFKLPEIVIFKKYTGIFIESIKMLIYNRGLIILLVLLFYIINTFELPKYCYKNKKSMLLTSYDYCEDVSLEEAEKYIDGLREELETISVDDYRYNILNYNIYELESRLNYAKSFDGKYDVRVLDELPFMVRFGYFGTMDRDAKTLILISTMILMFSYAYSYENKSKVMPFVKSTYNGSFKLKWEKYITVALMILILDIIIFGLDLYKYLYDYGAKNLNRDIANVSLLGTHIKGISILGFIILGELLRIIVFEIIGIIIINVSKFLSYEHTIAFLMLLLVVPGIVYLTGVDGVLDFSILKITEIVHLIK